MEMRVLCMGVLVADFFAKPVTGMPERGKLVPVDHVALHIGGCAVNTGVVLKKLGGDVAVMGRVGDDALGEFMIRSLRKEGLETKIILDSSINTSGSVVLIHADGERSFIHSIGANGTFALSDIDFEYVKKFSILHIAGALMMPKFDNKALAVLTERAKKEGLTVVLDTAWDSAGKWFSGLKDALPHVDYFLPSIEEARMIAGKQAPEDVAAFLLDCGVKNVGLKMGAGGSMVMNGGEKHFFPVLPIEVVDTCGCGDAYVAGFLAGLLRGYSFETCGLLANLAGAKTATAMGATTAVTSWKDLVAFGVRHGRHI